MQKNFDNTKEEGKKPDKRDKSQFDWVIRLIPIYHFAEQKGKQERKTRKTFCLLGKKRKLQDILMKANSGASWLKGFFFHFRAEFDSCLIPSSPAPKGDRYLCPVNEMSNLDLSLSHSLTLSCLCTNTMRMWDVTKKKKSSLIFSWEFDANFDSSEIEDLNHSPFIVAIV